MTTADPSEPPRSEPPFYGDRVGAPLDWEMDLAQGASRGVLLNDENALLASIETRLAEEVRRLVGALGEFAGRAQAIGKDIPDSAQFCKLVTSTFSLVALQLGHTLSQSADRPVFFDDGREYLAKLGLRFQDAFRQIDLDGRNFLAVALPDERSTEVKGSGDGTEEHSVVHGGLADFVGDPAMVPNDPGGAE